MPRLSLIASLTVFTITAAGCPEPQVDAPVDVVDIDDIDEDGVRNAIDEDIDGDGQQNIIDDDVDGDGTANADDETPYGESPNDEGAQGDIDNAGNANIIDNDDDNDGVPDGVEGVGSCDGVTPADDESSDCDGFCLEVEGGYLSCDDGGTPGKDRIMDGDWVWPFPEKK
jgi:hypothetical protein